MTLDTCRQIYYNWHDNFKNCLLLVYRHEVDTVDKSMSTENEYNLDRKAASRLLKVSIRTVDRYIKTKKLSTQAINGRIWLSRGEIQNFKSRQSRQAIVDKVDMSTSEMSIDNNVDNVGKTVDKVDNIVVGPRKNRGESGIFKKLYEEVKEELNEKQARLEIANYRVGQLETQVKNSIPLLEYHRENYEKNKAEERLKKDLEERENLVSKLKKQLKYAKFNKRIFLIILLVVLALQPLWLLLNSFE